jgi:hypothetical protein
VVKDEHQALQNSATRVWDLVLQRSSEAPSLAAALFSTTNLIEGHADAVATNGVHWGGPAGANHCIVTLPQAGARVGVTRVQVKCRPDEG